MFSKHFDKCDNFHDWSEIIFVIGEKEPGPEAGVGSLDFLVICIIERDSHQ